MLFLLLLQASDLVSVGCWSPISLSVRGIEEPRGLFVRGPTYPGDSLHEVGCCTALLQEETV